MASSRYILIYRPDCITQTLSCKQFLIPRKEALLWPILPLTLPPGRQSPENCSSPMAVLSAIKPEFVTVRYIDPQDGSVTRTMYSNNIPTICATVNPDGTAIWKGLTFPLIER